MPATDNLTLDTSGEVGPLPAGAWNERFMRWDDLSSFAQGYIAAMFEAAWESAGFRSQWLLRDVIGDVREEEWRNTRPGFSDLSPDALALILADCEAFDDLTSGSPRKMDWGLTSEMGSQFRAARQRRDYRAVPPLTVSLGDEGKVHLAEAA